MSGAIIPFPAKEDEGTHPAPIVEHEATNSDLALLVEQIRDKDQQAFSRLYHLTVDRVFALARFILKSPEDAEEVTTDVYAQAWEAAGRYDPARGAVMTWLLVRCRSRALDLIRRRKALRTAHEKNSALESSRGIGDDPTPEDILDHVQRGTAVHRALSELNPQRREVLTLAYFRGMSHIEIAQATGLPIGTVKSHVRRALRTLREHIEA